VNTDPAYGHGFAKQQRHLVLSFVGRQPTQRALLALAEAYPVLDVGRFQRVEQMLRPVGSKNKDVWRWVASVPFEEKKPPFVPF
jgi:hypothetical protein